MKINSVSEFFQFIRSNGLVNLAPEVRAMVVCMEEYGRLCPCDPDSVRINKYTQCKAFYVAFIRKIRKVGDYKKDLVTRVSDGTIEFRNDGQYISTISRN